VRFYKNEVQVQARLNGLEACGA